MFVLFLDTFILTFFITMHIANERHNDLYLKGRANTKLF